MRRDKIFLRREQSIKWMLRGLLFLIILSAVDVFFRRAQALSSPQESLYRVLLILSVAGVLQFPVGLYCYMRHWIMEGQRKKPDSEE